MTDTLTTETVRWTKVGSEWGVRGPARIVTPGATVTAENRQGDQKVVTIGADVWADSRNRWDTEDMAVGILVDERKAQAAEVPEGLHFLDGTAYKVQTSKSSGRRYAKELADGSWHYDPQAIRELSAETVATLEQATAFGKLHGTCMCCGRDLTNPESIELGIGPVCRKRYF